MVREFRYLKTLVTKPIPKYKQTSELPPDEKNGKVTPITGKTEVHIPIFMTVCANSIA